LSLETLVYASAPYGVGNFFLASRKKPEKSRVYHYKDSLSPLGTFGFLIGRRLMATACARRVSFFEEGAFMSLFKLFGTGSFRRFWAQGVFALLVLPAVILVIGCADPTSPEFELQAATPEWIRDNLAGKFADQFGGEITITVTTFNGSFVYGNIEHVTLFSENSGVIFIRLGPTAENWDGSPRSGFTGHHFANLDSTGFNGADAFAATGNDFPTLAAAQTQFTVGNIGIFFGNMTSRFERVD